MCQLLGISANKAVDIKLSLREFRLRGKTNYHGWGFAFCEKENWKVIKAPMPLHRENIQEEKFRFKSKIIIGHVRLASCGDYAHENTHPFKIDNWIFAHNGTVTSIMNHPHFELGEWKPEGQTDSEYAFCYLLHKLNANSFRNVKTIIEQEAGKIKKYGEFNFLLSDGKNLYAYGDDSLFYVKRKAPFEFVTLRDDQYEVHLSEVKAPDEKAVIVATEPLTDEKWIRISGLKIFKNGEEIK